MDNDKGGRGADKCKGGWELIRVRGEEWSWTWVRAGQRGREQ